MKMPRSFAFRRPDKERAASPVRRSERQAGHPLESFRDGAGNRATARLFQTALQISKPGDAQEQDADAAASRVVGTHAVPAPVTTAVPVASPSGTADPQLPAARSAGGSLPRDVRAFMEARFAADFGQVRVHTGEQAHVLNRDLNAEAFTYGRDIYFGAGRAPGNDALTAHELAHVVQQTGGALHGGSTAPVRTRAAEPRVQCSRIGSFPVTMGAIEVDLETREGALGAPPTKSGLDGYIRFVPAPDAPNSNVIAFVQAAKVTDTAGADAGAVSIPAAQGLRGSLGQGGLLSQDDARRNVEGGFLIDVLHQAGPAGVRQQGDAVSPQYPIGTAAPGTVGFGGTTIQPAQYGGGTGASFPVTPGFKRSSGPADIRSASMYDFPGTDSTAANLDFSFESLARGEDTMVTYGGLRWGFGLRAGHVVNERYDVVNTASATFDETLERFRDFYVHEPVTLYFDFDRDALVPAEATKIDACLAYLGRNSTVAMSIEGFADIRGGASVHNRDLARRRAEAVAAAIVTRGIAPGRITAVTVGDGGVGASTLATTNAGTGDQGGDAAVGADQDREANRWANRRVVITFTQTASVVRPLAGGGTGP